MNLVDKNRKRTFLFLQGPISPFFQEIADGLEKLGHKCLRINLCFGDLLFWRKGNAYNYRKGQSEWPDFIENFLVKNNVTDILLLGEQRYYHKVAIECAKSRNISIAVTDFGYLRPDWITFEKNGMSGTSLFPKKPKVILDQAKDIAPFTKSVIYKDSFKRMARWDILYHLSSILMHPLFPKYKTHQLYNPILIYLSTALVFLKKNKENEKGNKLIEELQRSQQKYFVFAMQMATDFSVRAYSKYNRMDDAIEEIITSFGKHADSQSRLVIKIHPLDPGLVNWKKRIQKLAKYIDIIDRVDILYGGDLNKLLRLSSGLVTINSTVGIWALSEMCPVKLLGQAIYDIEGLVHSGSLDSFWKKPKTPSNELCDAFFRLLASTVQIRGTFYNRPGLDVAVNQAVVRLHNTKLNEVCNVDPLT